MLERIAAGRTDLVFQWVENGGDPGALFDGASLAQHCAFYGDVSAIRYLQIHGVCLEELGPNFDLNGAAFHGHWRLCEFLIENGANALVAMSATGETPLHSSFCSRQSEEHLRVVQVLLANGADPNAVTKPGVETGAFMRDVRTRGETPLHRAAACGPLRAIECLIEAGGNVEARDAYGDTPLSWASWAMRDTDVLNLLCFPPYQVNPNRKSMKEYLIGSPVKK